MWIHDFLLQQIDLVEKQDDWGLSEPPVGYDCLEQGHAFLHSVLWKTHRRHHGMSRNFKSEIRQCQTEALLCEHIHLAVISWKWSFAKRDALSWTERLKSSPCRWTMRTATKEGQVEVHHCDYKQGTERERSQMVELPHREAHFFPSCIHSTQRICFKFLYYYFTSLTDSARTSSYSLSATRNKIEVTFSKQWIHFLLSERWPPTSTILQV